MQQSSLPRLCQVLRSGQVFHLFFVAGGGTFELRHSGLYACGIPDRDTIVMTGGVRLDYEIDGDGFLEDYVQYPHIHVTRCITIIILGSCAPFFTLAP